MTENLDKATFESHGTFSNSRFNKETGWALLAQTANATLESHYFMLMFIYLVIDIIVNNHRVISPVSV